MEDLLLRTSVAARPAVAQTLAARPIGASCIANVRFAKFEVSVVGSQSREGASHLQQLSPQRVDQVEPEAAWARGLDVEEEEEEEDDEKFSGAHFCGGASVKEVEVKEFRKCRVGKVTD